MKPKLLVGALARSARRLAWWAGLCFAFPLTAMAQTEILPPAAQDAISKGVAAANAQDYLGAIGHFQDARQAAPNAPEVYYDLGLAESKIPGRELRAIAWFGAYLTGNPNASNAAAVNEFIVGLQIKSKGNINLLIKTVQNTDDQIPDTPITQNNGIIPFTNKPDIDRVENLYKVANLWAQAGNSENAITLAHRIGAAGYSESEALREIGRTQAEAGHIADAVKTVSLMDSADIGQIQLAVAAAETKSGDSAAARETLTAEQIRIAKSPEAYVRNSELSGVIVAQIGIGDVLGAQKTALLIPDPLTRGSADVSVAEAEVQTGDSVGAQSNIRAARQDADLWTSMSDAQRSAACGCSPNIAQMNSQKESLETRIGHAQLQADNITGARTTSPQPNAMPKMPPAISVADWTRELDQLNKPMFLDFVGALKAPQATYKNIYPGSSGFDDSNNDPRKTFDALVTIASAVISAQNTVDQMLEQLVQQKGTP